MFGISTYIAWRYLWAKQKEVFVTIINIFSIIGITLGVATLIIVMSVMNGYEYELMTKILQFQGHINIINKEGSMNKYHGLISTIRHNDNKKLINTMYPILESQAMIMSGKSFSGVVLKGLVLEDIEKKASIPNLQIKDNQVILGLALADRLAVNVGDKIKLVLPQTTSTIIGSIPRMKTYEVGALFDSGMYEYNSSIVLMPLQILQKLLDLDDQVTTVEITALDIDNIGEIVSDLLTNLAGQYRIIDWQHNNKSFVEALKVERNVMFLILLLIIIIAAFNIIASLMIMVKDKKKSIAILRTVGLPKKVIVKIFCLYGFTIGCIGTFLGALLGTLFAINIDKIKNIIENTFGYELFDQTIYFLTHLPSKLHAIEVIQIVIISLIISLLTTIYPAIKIAKISPAQLLKND